MTVNDLFWLFLCIQVHLEELFLGYRLLSVNIIYNRDMSTE